MWFALSTLRFDIAGGSYAVGCGISKSCSATGFAVALGAVALGGAISGGVGGMGTSMATNMAYGTLGNMASYTATSAAFGDGPTAGGYAGAIVGGLAGGVMPGYEASAGGIGANIVGEVAYSSGKGAFVGAISGGAGSVFSGANSNSIAGDAMLGASRGAIGGALGAGIKIGVMGVVMPKSAPQVGLEKHAEKSMGVDVGDYGSVNRRYGLIGFVNKTILGNEGGISLGRNNVAWSDDVRVQAHEGMHYIEQVDQGPFEFYENTVKDYSQTGFMNTYGTIGSNEFWADYYSGNNVWGSEPYRGFHDGY